ncbi:hypothetical protein EMEDMD4_170051 [Sinorhizobium medicae]|uniref:Uncharacterized protein n=1 Tax=Sinorhizobium medicae TaxID=110321 RepID=A0A508WWZ5_9HYPH|nr:hypothetical protein EMEDMD4_170051 [Sinorhizobium medicae]
MSLQRSRVRPQSCGTRRDYWAAALGPLAGSAVQRRLVAKPRDLSAAKVWLQSYRERYSSREQSVSDHWSAKSLRKAGPKSHRRGCRAIGG